MTSQYATATAAVAAAAIFKEAEADVK